METLPSSIEAYLAEAGFSGTEMVVLRKLLEEDALTLRELASKTGKSTGVLDQAVKKLLKKKILSRESINGTPKYVVRSLQSIIEWMEEDMKTKQETLKRRHENFESFVLSLTMGKKRPEMEYFEGLDGLKNAYMQLLERGNDIMQYGPILHLAEEDPLGDFRVQWFRDRRNRGMFSRVITHDNMLGRRYQSRDPFEYRKTILVNEHLYPMFFEKIIIGDTVACFQLEEQRACFIRYPELADNERHFFERLWNKKISYQQAASAGTQQAGENAMQNQPPLATHTASKLRDFLFGRANIATMALLGIVSATLTYGLYLHTLKINTMRIRELARSIAATGTLQIDPDNLITLYTAENKTTPAYEHVTAQLENIRRQNEDVAYVSLLRPADDPGAMHVMAEAGATPGERIAAADGQPHEDERGTWIASRSPILLSGGAIAMLEVGIDAHSVVSVTRSSFAGAYWFIGFLLLFLIIRLATFNTALPAALLARIPRPGRMRLIGNGDDMDVGVPFLAEGGTS